MMSWAVFNNEIRRVLTHLKINPSTVETLFLAPKEIRAQMLNPSILSQKSTGAMY
jgi:hypothetical protein